MAANAAPGVFAHSSARGARTDRVNLARALAAEADSIAGAAAGDFAGEHSRRGMNKSAER